MWFQAPENDYSALRPPFPSPAPRLRVAVCIPVYNRVDLLARTVAALVPQSYPKELYEVVIGDDGSEEDVEAALEPLRPHLPVTVHRRERDGYGAGQARNLAAARADTDVLVFIDADCLPDVDLVARHAGWHEQAENLVVIGSRHGLDTTALDVERLVAGDADMRSAVFGSAQPGLDDVRHEDHRRILHRRTNDQRFGDEEFRSLVSSNFSIRRDRFLAVGGFDETFHRWGGEDVELGWRCQSAGLFFVAEDHAIVYHQLQEDAWEAAGREQSKERNWGVIQNKIPHSFYRKYRAGHIWEVPKVSMVVHPVMSARLTELADQVRRQSYSDWELIVNRGDETVELFAETNAADPRFRVVDAESPIDLLSATRGEYVALVHGDAALEPRAVAVLVRRLENQRRSGMATCSYLVGDRIYRHPDDLARVDAAWGEGVPVFCLVRRRDLSRAVAGASSLPEAMVAVRSLARSQHVREAYVAVRSEVPGDDVGSPHPAFVSATTRLRTEVSQAGLRTAAVKAVVSHLLDRKPAPQRKAQPADQDRGDTQPTIRYVGWTGHDNMGDEVLLRTITDLLAWGEVRTAKRGDLLLLGGGTLINRGSYLTWLEDQDSPRLERAVLGTGVANPEFWGDPDEKERWVDWLDTCAYVGVRGPHSAAVLDDWGVSAEVEVVGDAALLLDLPAPRVEGRVVISPCRTRGELWGGEDGKVYDALASLTRTLAARGHEVHLLAAHPDDDGPIIQISRSAGLPDLPYHAGYDDVDGALRLLASADLVVAERLHSAVLAAAATTPFVALEYRPKVRDFSHSVGMEDYTVRTDDLAGLIDLATTALSAREQLSSHLRERRDDYRRRLQQAGSFLEKVMTG